MNDQPEQPSIDLADIARRAGAEALAALIEAARGKPSAVTVAAAKALIELGHDADGGGSPARSGDQVVTFTLLPSEAREIGERLTKKLDDLAERAQAEPICPTCGRPRASQAEAPPAAPLIGRPAPAHALEAAAATPAPTIPRTEPEPMPPQVDTGYIAQMIRQNGAYFPGD